MARTKISEFSATAADNTDIDNIDIAEGCAPSGINNAIRELMAQLKDMQTGASGDTFTLTTVNSTTVDTTNLEVTNLKAKDGTAAGSIANSTGIVTLASSVLTTTDINGGTIDGTSVGASTRGSGAFTTLASNGATTFTANTASTSTTTGTAVITGGLGVSGRINAANFDGIVGANTAAAGSFTNFAYTGTLTGGTGVIAIGTSQIYKDASGNVGIGTSSPISRLDVAGTTGFTWGSGVNSTALTVIGTQGTSGGSLFVNTPSVNTSFASGLAVDGSYSSLASVINIKAAGVNSAGGYSGSLAFHTSSNQTLSEKMRITGAGNVGIGTSSPGTKLDVRTSLSATANPQWVSDFYAVTSGSTDGTYGGGIRLYTKNLNGNYWPAAIAALNDAGGSNLSSLGFYTGTAGPTLNERMRIDSSGIVTMSAYGAGAATFSAAGVISSVSDETWKTKDGVPANPDEMLQKLEPGYWFYNEEKAPVFGSERQLGFYAQNVNAAIGDEAAPIPEEGKPWGYYDRSVLAITVMSLKNVLKAIQEQQAIITQLQADVAALKGN